MKIFLGRAMPLCLAVLTAACGNDMTGPNGRLADLAAVLPANGTIGVDPRAPVALEFTTAMMPGMEQHVVLHEGDSNGPVVAGSWSWSADYRRLTFTPAVLLKSQTKYTVHMGMNMDAAGHEQHHTGAAGGQMGGMGAGMMGGSGMMLGGSHGAACTMVSSFTTS